MQFIIFRIIVIPRIFSEKGRVGIGMSFTLKSKVFFFFFFINVRDFRFDCTGALMQRKMKYFFHFDFYIILRWHSR